MVSGQFRTTLLNITT